MIWKMADVQDGVAYKLQLCHSQTNQRTLRLVAQGSPEDVNRPADVVSTTHVVPQDLLLRRAVHAIADAVLLENGERFYVESHGIWLLGSEWKALGERRDHAAVPWVTGNPPVFSPR